MACPSRDGSIDLSYVCATFQDEQATGHVFRRFDAQPVRGSLLTLDGFAMTKLSLLRQLEGGDRRSIGRSNAVVAHVLADPSCFAELFAGLSADDAAVRARAADAVEKISVVHPEYLRPYKTTLLGLLARCEQNEV